nr:MAG TPA: hypothetical protein [Caudoviricetes sp.]
MAFLPSPSTLRMLEAGSHNRHCNVDTLLLHN